MKHDDILKRARLLAQAANDAADAAVAQAQSVDSTPPSNPQPISSKATTPVAVSTVSLPSLNKQEKNSSSVEKKSKGKSSSKEFTNETRPPAENLQSLPAINKKINTDEKKADEELNSKLTQLHEPHPSLPVVPSPIKNDLDQTETISKESTACEEVSDTIKESIPHSASSPVDHTKPPPILHVEDQEGDSDDPVTQYIQEYLKSRAKVVVRKHAPQQVLCYLCCGEFGTASLLIHQKTCWTKHEWALDRILNDETLSIKEAKKNWKKCEVPSNGSSLPSLPSTGSDPILFEEYNQEALRLFCTHVLRCLWCRMNNSIAKMIEDRVKRAEDERKRRRELEEEERRRREREEEERRRREAEEEAERRRREAEEEEERRRREEEERRRREEEERRRMQLEDEASEAERRRLLALGKHNFLRKGKGIQAANQTAKLMEEKERDDRAKQEIINYSLNQAKRKGYVSETMKKKEESTVKFIEVTDKEMAELMEKQTQNGSTPSEWDSKWSLEEEEVFANSEVILRNKCI